MTIPSFLLAKLYVKGSLKNTADGFEFALKNLIDSTSLSAVGPVTVGGVSYAAPVITLVVDDRSWESSALSPSTPVPMPVNKSFRIVVRGDKLPPGQAKVSMAAVSVDVGLLKFDFADKVAD